MVKTILRIDLDIALAFLSAINDTNKPVVLSTGMSTQKQIDKSISLLKNVEYILACTSTYPTPDEEVNLRYITTLKSLYPDIKIGFSNHNNGVVPLFASAALGAEYIEFHITKDRTAYGSDQASSIEKVTTAIKGIRKTEKMLGSGKKVIFDSEKPILEKLRKVDDILD